MSWHAVGAVDDAVDATRRFLFPFSLVRWAKLALLVLLMGGTSFFSSVSVPPFPNVESETAGWSDFVALAAELGVSTAVLVGLAVGLFLLWALFAVVSLSLRLVFYDALRTNVVRLWEPFKRRLRAGAALLGFSLGLSVVLVAPFGAVGYAAYDGIISLDGLSMPAVAALVLAAVAWVVGWLLVYRFTFEFAVPVMVLRNEGPVAAWRRLWPTLRESWLGFLGYLVVHLVLGIGISVVETVSFLLVGGTVAVLAGVVLLVGAGLLGGFGALTATTAGTVLLAAVVLVALVTLFVVLLPVRVVTRTYLIAYEVSMLGRTDPDLMLLSDDLDPNADDGGADDGEGGADDGEGGGADDGEGGGADDGEDGGDGRDGDGDVGAGDEGEGREGDEDGEDVGVVDDEGVGAADTDDHLTDAASDDSPSDAEFDDRR